MKEKVLKFIMESAQEFCFEPVAPEKNLFDSGLNSINAIELIVKLETKYKVRFDDEELDLHNITSLDRLTDMVLMKIQEQSRGE